MNFDDIHRSIEQGQILYAGKEYSRAAEHFQSAYEQAHVAALFPERFRDSIYRKLIQTQCRIGDFTEPPQACCIAREELAYYRAIFHYTSFKRLSGYGNGSDRLTEARKCIDEATMSVRYRHRKHLNARLKPSLWTEQIDIVLQARGTIYYKSWEHSEQDDPQYLRQAIGALKLANQINPHNKDTLHNLLAAYIQLVRAGRDLRQEEYVELRNYAYLACDLLTPADHIDYSINVVLATMAHLGFDERDRELVRAVDRRHGSRIRVLDPRDTGGMQLDELKELADMLEQWFPERDESGSDTSYILYKERLSGIISFAVRSSGPVKLK